MRIGNFDFYYCTFYDALVKAIDVNPENLNFVGKTGGQTLERNKRQEDFQRSI
jgi:hypothetical protein